MALFDTVRPCPFCASMDLVTEDLGPNDLSCVECVTCSARGPTVRDPYERRRAIVVWNRRDRKAK
jgi:Lar family restriction alleviation protein